MREIQSPKTKGRGRLCLLAPTLAVLAGFLVAPVWARTQATERRPKGRKFDVVRLAKNQWALHITNYGSFGHDVAGNRSGGEWPRGTGNMYIYGAGIWFGRMNRTAVGADTNVTVGYNPNSGKAEFSPGAAANAGSGYAGREYERVYMYPEDWPPNPEDFPEELRDSVRTPLVIPPSGGGDPIYGWFYPIPREPTSTGDCWSVFNDLDVSLMEDPGKARSCSIEVYQFTYDWALPWNRDVVFFVCHVKNIGHDTIRDAYMGMVCDADIGAAPNDFTGLLLRKWIHNQAGSDSVWVDNVGMAWSKEEVGWPTFPGVVGFDFLQSPFKKNAEGRTRNFPDTTQWYPNGVDDNLNGLVDEPAEGEQIGMTAYKTFTLSSSDPMGDGNQYLALQGREWWVQGAPYNPYDSLPSEESDKRFLQSSGPFMLPPDSMVTLTIAIVGAPLSRLPSDRDTSFYALAVNDRAAQQAYDNNWISPVPPPSPNFVLQPGDGKVTVLWDNMPERVADPFYPLSRALKSPYYREFDFQGYKIYRSRTGKVGDWTLLDQFDLRDGIVFQDSAQPDSIRSIASDKGLVYAFVDTNNLRYGFPYYYAVTSFDYNTLGTPDTMTQTDTTHLISESGMLPQATQTRTEPVNVRPPRSEVAQTAGNSRLGVRIEPSIIVPSAIREDNVEVQFGGVRYNPSGFLPVYNFAVVRPPGEVLVPAQEFTINPRKFTDTLRLTATVFDSVVQRVAMDTVTGETTVTKGWLPVMEVLVKVKMDSVPQRIFDSVQVIRGDRSPFDFGMSPALAASFYNCMWSYRGSDYRIVWRLNDAGKMTAEVTDLTLNLPVDYRPVLFPANGESLAAGWCLYDSIRATLLRSPTDTMTVGRTRAMYINGGQFDLRGGRTITALPEPGDTWLVNALKYLPAPIYATYGVTTWPQEIATDGLVLNVKVVPNPYLVRNEWERHPDYRRLKFINLPDKCRIRVFTMAGDWIRTIEHDATNARIGSSPNQQGGDEDWDLLSASGQKPAPGIYIFHVESDAGNQVGKFAIVY